MASKTPAKFLVTMEHQTNLGRVKISVKALSNDYVEDSQIVVYEEELKLVDIKTDAQLSSLRFPNFKVNPMPNPFARKFDSAGDSLMYFNCATKSSNFMIVQKDASVLEPAKKADPCRSLMEHKTTIEYLQRHYEKTDQMIRTRVLTQIICRKCSAKLQEFYLLRVLPLPSIDWVEDSREWFCACNSKRSGQYSMDICTPFRGDVLYSQSFCTINAEHNSLLGFLGNTDGASKNNLQVITCFSCNFELGMTDGTKIMVWNNLVKWKSEKVKDKEEEHDSSLEMTFRKVLDDLVKDVQFLSAKILIQNCVNSTDCLLIHTLKSSGVSWRGHLESESAQEFVELRSRIPVLYSKVEKDPGNYSNFKVTPQLFKTAMEMLEKSTEESLPKLYQTDPISGMKIGYVQLL